MIWTTTNIQQQQKNKFTDIYSLLVAICQNRKIINKSSRMTCRIRVQSVL